MVEEKQEEGRVGEPTQESTTARWRIPTSKLDALDARLLVRVQLRVEGFKGRRLQVDGGFLLAAAAAAAGGLLLLLLGFHSLLVAIIAGTAFLLILLLLFTTSLFVLMLLLLLLLLLFSLMVLLRFRGAKVGEERGRGRVGKMAEMETQNLAKTPDVKQGGSFVVGRCHQTRASRNMNPRLDFWRYKIFLGGGSSDDLMMIQLFAIILRGNVPGDITSTESGPRFLISCSSA